MKCSHCHGTERLVKYSTNKKYPDKQYYMCDKCNTERAKRYRQTSEGKNATRKAVHKYELTHKKRKATWSKSRKINYISHYYKLKSKEYTGNKTPCVVCGKLPTHKHHPDINKPMEVIFLCEYHHKQAHKHIDTE